MEYYSAIKNVLLKHAIIYMNLKTIMLSKRSQTKKRIYTVILFIQNSRKCKLLIYNDRREVSICLKMERLRTGHGGDRFTMLTVVMVSHVYAEVNIYQIVHVKYVQSVSIITINLF